MYKKIVNHPFLIHQPREELDYPSEETIKVSGKMLVLDAMLKQLKAEGHKVLIYSTWKLILDFIETYLVMRGYQYFRLDGETDLDVRKEDIQAFNSDPDIFTYILSTRAGGLGINLTAADTVILFDSDWV